MLMYYLIMAFICFDLDNTLIYADMAHSKAYFKALNMYKGKFPIKEISENRLIRKFGRVGRTILKELFPCLTRAQITTLVRKHNDFLIKDTYSIAKPIPGAKQALKLLGKKHTLGLLTNCHTKTMLKLLKTTGIDKNIFEICIGNDQVLHPKPEPDEIYKAQHLVHKKADYMVGDSIYDIVAANKANVKAISVLTGTTSKTALKQQRPYKILPSVKDLPKFIKKDLMV